MQLQTGERLTWILRRLPPDNDWEYIANLTGDSAWSAETMRNYLTQIENNHYIERNSSGSEGHGFDGWLGVSLHAEHGAQDVC